MLTGIGPNKANTERCPRALLGRLAEDHVPGNGVRRKEHVEIVYEIAVGSDGRERVVQKRRAEKRGRAD